MKSLDIVSSAAKDTYCSEEYFQRMLVLERLRSKKTGKPFTLILLNIGKLVKGKRAEKAFVLHRLVSVLDSSTHDIDIKVKGWYMFDSTIGIICQDVLEKHRKRVTCRLKDKLREEGILNLVGNKADAVKLLSF
jgi:hypothetical protein